MGRGLCRDHIVEFTAAELASSGRADASRHDPRSRRRAERPRLRRQGQSLGITNTDTRRSGIHLPSWRRAVRRPLTVTSCAADWHPCVRDGVRPPRFAWISDVDHNGYICADGDATRGHGRADPCGHRHCHLEQWVCGPNSPCSMHTPRRSAVGPVARKAARMSPRRAASERANANATRASQSTAEPFVVEAEPTPRAGCSTTAGP